MVQRVLVTGVFAILVFGSISLGWYLADPKSPPSADDHIQSITGVTSGNAGTDDPEQTEEAEGVDQTPPTEPPPASSANPSESIEVPEDAVPEDAVPEDVVKGVTDDEGSFQAIRGIEGIDNVPLQNLEAVLRMQEPPQKTPPQGGGARAAAQLLTMDTEETTELQPIEDGREEMTEIELDGS